MPLQEAARQAEAKRAADSAQSVLARMQQHKGSSSGSNGHARTQVTWSPAEAEKETGNGAFKRGEWEQVSYAERKAAHSLHGSGLSVFGRRAHCCTSHAIYSLFLHLPVCQRDLQVGTVLPLHHQAALHAHTMQQYSSVCNMLGTTMCCWCLMPVQAIAHYTKALELDPKLAAAYSNRAMARLKLGDAVGAETDCDYALLLQPHNAKALLRRGAARCTTRLQRLHAGACPCCACRVRRQHVIWA